MSVLTGSVLSTLLDAGLLFLLRFALDDSVERVMSAAVHALKALLVCAEDEVRQIVTHLNLLMKCVHDYCLVKSHCSLLVQ